MKLLHFLIINILVAISLIVVLYIIIPITFFVQPLQATIVGYDLTTCYAGSHEGIIQTLGHCKTTRATTTGNNSYTLHEGDKFKLDVSVTNPNVFSIDFDSASTTFDKNAVEHHYEGCGCCGIGYVFSSFESTEITVPTTCADDIANSTGETNATVQIQYHINGKPYSVSASQIITILPKTGN